MTPEVSVILPTHQPHRRRLERVLVALRQQTLTMERWETVVIDNASSPALTVEALTSGPANLRLVREPELGLTAARKRGFIAARAPLCVLVDDDNVLAPDYLAHVVRLFAEQPKLGAAGGKSLPEFEEPPPDWAREFLPLLALRDGGELPLVAEGMRSPGDNRNRYPDLAAPIGAGMALRSAALTPWLAGIANGWQVPDRRGRELTSGGDNDIVFSVLKSGWAVGYFPELTLTHLIPATRLGAGYLGRLNYGIQRSWVRVLKKHDACPWPTIGPWTVPIRQLKAWISHHAWQDTASHIRWRGAAGRLAGQAEAGLD